jgi:hypothetical protein
LEDLTTPADYVNELAEQAFKKIAAGTGEEIVRILPDRPKIRLHSRTN